jgi:UDP-glucose 4-epimerase
MALYKEDIRNKETISDIVKRGRIGICIHLAAKTSVTESLVTANDIMDVNVNGCASVLEACTENGVKNFVFASSAAVYGEARSLPISEDHPLNPISPYGGSKMEAEKLVSSSGIQNAVCLRLFNVYGDGQNPEYAGVITRFAERIAKSLPPIIYGDGRQTRDFISVKDAVDAITLSVGSSGTFNIGTGRSIMIKNLARKMLDIAELNIEPVYEEKNMDHEIRQSAADTAKAANLLKFVARIDLKTGLEQLLHGTDKSTQNSS